MEQAERIDTPWGPWQTAGFGSIVLIASIMGQTMAGIVFLIAKVMSDPQADFQAFAEYAMEDGTLMSATILAGSIIGFGVTVFFAWLRAKDRAKSYLGFFAINPGAMLICLGATALFMIIADSTTYFLERPVVHEFMESAYRSVAFKPLLWFTVCIAAPFFEEFFFRGFLIKGWETSRLGPVGAVILSSLIWTAIHVQYGWYELIQIFILGLILGYMRLKTGSTIPAVACHVFNNFIATIETAVVVSRSM